MRKKKILRWGNNFSVNFPLLSYRCWTAAAAGRESQLCEIGKVQVRSDGNRKSFNFSPTESSTRLIYISQHIFLSSSLDCEKSWKLWVDILTHPRDMATNFKQIKRLTSWKLSENWCCEKVLPSQQEWWKSCHTLRFQYQEKEKSGVSAMEISCGKWG